MPGFDGTGPRGMGPMTGGGRGFCNPYSPVYSVRPGYAIGFGRPAWGARGSMFGRGMGHGIMGRGMRLPYAYGAWGAYAPLPYARGLPHTPYSYGAIPYGRYPYGW